MQNHKFVQDLSRINKRAACSSMKSYSREIAKIYKKQILTDKQTHYKTVNMLIPFVVLGNVVCLRWEGDRALGGYKETRI